MAVVRVAVVAVVVDATGDCTCYCILEAANRIYYHREETVLDVEPALVPVAPVPVLGLAFASFAPALDVSEQLVVAVECQGREISHSVI